MIEKGRHQKTPLPRPERLCPFCQVIEDETHIIIACIKYENGRNPLCRTCSETSIHFETMTNEMKFVFILSNEDTNITSKLVSFMYNCLKKGIAKLANCLDIFRFGILCSFIYIFF